MPVEEFTHDDGLVRPDACARAFGFARSVSDQVRSVDAATKAIGGNDTITGTLIARQISKVEDQLRTIGENPLVKKNDPEHSEVLDQVREALSILESTLKRLKDLSARKDAIYDASKEMRRHARLARSAWKVLADREAAVQARRLEIDDIMVQEVCEQARSLSVCLQEAANADEMVARAEAIRAEFSTLAIPDTSGLLERLKAHVDQLIPLVKKDESRKGEATDPKPRSKPFSPMPSSRPGNASPQRAGGSVKYEPPKKHVKFGVPLSPHEMEKSSEQFFRRLWHEGLPQSRNADIMFSTTMRSEGLTVHDALAYSKGVDELYKSIAELKVKFIR